MSDERCLLCSEPPEDNHHVTGTDAGDAYLDPGLTGPLCHDCHELVGDDAHTAGMPTPETTDTFLGSLKLRLSRTASFVGRVAECLPEPFASFFALLATHLARWAARLHDSITVLDENLPQWRGLAGV